MGRAINTSNRARWAIRLMWGSLIAYVLKINYFFLNGLPAETAITFVKIQEVLTILLQISSIIAFIIWVCGACYNLNQWIDNFDYSLGWPIGYWFIPGVNLYLFYKILQKWHIESLSYLNSVKESLNEYLKNVKNSKKLTLTSDYTKSWAAGIFVYVFFCFFSYIIFYRDLDNGVKTAGIILLLFFDFFRNLYFICTISLVQEYSNIEDMISYCRRIQSKNSHQNQIKKEELGSLKIKLFSGLKPLGLSSPQNWILTISCPLILIAFLLMVIKFDYKEGLYTFALLLSMMVSFCYTIILYRNDYLHSKYKWIPLLMCLIGTFIHTPLLYTHLGSSDNWFHTYVKFSYIVFFAIVYVLSMICLYKWGTIAKTDSRWVPFSVALVSNFIVLILFLFAHSG